MSTLLRAASASVLLLTMIPVSAFAQDSATAGLVMGAPSSIGIIWHLNDAVALRPEIGFSITTSKNESPSGVLEATQRTFTPGFSVLFYTSRLDALRTYVSSRYAYSRAHAKSSSQFGSSESTGTSHAVSGSFGAEYSLHRRFAVFGEVGITFSHAESATASSNSWSHRSAVGAILYF